jgi:uncharacterized protein YgiM (DUF1202 family)
MRNRVISAFAVGCVGCLLFSVCSHTNVKQQGEYSATAGIISASAVNVDEASDVDISSSGVTVTSAAEEEREHYGYTNLGVANVEGNINIREEATTDSSIVGKLPENAGCEILSQEGDWLRISSGEVEGYVLAEYILTGTEALDRADEVAAEIATVTADTLRVRQEPSIDAQILALMPQGEEVEVLSHDGDWIQVNVDNEIGYINSEFVSCSIQIPDAMTMSEVRFGAGISDVRVSLVSFATQYVGNPYVWGGTSLTRGADCSGFVLSVYAQYGISLPHSSAAQANYGRRISTSELQPGDLLFYGSGGISHVAIYIGNGQIVHASTERTGIIISNAFYRSPICCVSLLD